MQGDGPRPRRPRRLHAFRSVAGTRAHPSVCNWLLMSRDRRSRRRRSSLVARSAQRRRCCPCRRSRRASTVVGSAKLCTMRKKSAYGLASINRSFVISMPFDYRAGGQYCPYGIRRISLNPFGIRLWVTEVAPLPPPGENTIEALRRRYRVPRGRDRHEPTSLRRSRKSRGRCGYHPRRGYPHSASRNESS
jgi:hypothetical protein